MLSNSVFYVPWDVKITLKNQPKNLGNIQFDCLSTTFFLDKIVANRVKKQREFDPWILTKIINKFPTLPPRGGGVSELGKIPYFFFFFFFETFPYFPMVFFLKSKSVFSQLTFLLNFPVSFFVWSFCFSFCCFKWRLEPSICQKSSKLSLVTWVFSAMQWYTPL